MATQTLFAALQRRPFLSASFSALAASVAYASYTEEKAEYKETCYYQINTNSSIRNSFQRFIFDTSSTTAPPPKLPRNYDRDEIEAYWSSRPRTVIERLINILIELTPLLGAYVFDFKLKEKQNEISDGTNKTILQREHAIALREALTRLGPAFVKMGQQLSIRPDLVPPPVLKELQKLCDSVEPVPDEVALQVLKEELLHGVKGGDLTELFVDIPHRVASASLGQVYKATLKENGKEVAIKVQRPDMMKRLSLDLFILQKYGKMMDTICEVLTEQIPYHENFINAFCFGSYMELDYENEAANQLRFRKELKRRKCNNVIIPAVYTHYSSRRVLTTEWIQGIKLVDAPQEQIRTLIPIGVELFLTQLLDIGAFHADPHPANLYVVTTNNKAKLCLLDFGLCAEIDERSRRAMTAAIVNLLSGDFHSLISRDAKELGFLPEEMDVTEIKPILTKILTKGLLEAGSNLHDRKRKLLDISQELNEVFFKYPFSVPPFFALVTRGLGLLEGIALSGDPDFDIFHASLPYARKRAVDLFGSNFLELRKLQQQQH